MSKPQAWTKIPKYLILSFRKKLVILFFHVYLLLRLKKDSHEKVIALFIQSLVLVVPGKVRQMGWYELKKSSNK